MANQFVFHFEEKLYPKLELLFGHSNSQLLTALRSEQFKMLLVWGSPQSGKSYLLDIWVKEHRARGQSAVFLSGERDLSFFTEPENFAAYDYFAVDDIDAFDDRRQQQLFYLMNEVIDAGKHLLVSAQHPPQQLAHFRTDLKTRLGLCLIYQLQPLTEAERIAALQEFIYSKQSNIPQEVIAYLARHCPRDLNFLLGSVARLDEYAVQVQRKITVPLLKELLAAEKIAKERFVDA